MGLVTGLLALVSGALVSRKPEPEPEKPPEPDPKDRKIADLEEKLSLAEAELNERAKAYAGLRERTAKMARRLSEEIDLRLHLQRELAEINYTRRYRVGPAPIVRASPLAPNPASRAQTTMREGMVGWCNCVPARSDVIRNQFADEIRNQFSGITGRIND